VTWLLATAGLDTEAVDIVAYNFDGRHYFDALPATEPSTGMPTTADRASARADSFRKVHQRFGQRMEELRSRFPAAGHPGHYPGHQQAVVPGLPTQGTAA
jgi:carbamoyltransferase